MKINEIAIEKTLSNYRQEMSVIYSRTLTDNKYKDSEQHKLDLGAAKHILQDLKKYGF